MPLAQSTADLETELLELELKELETKERTATPSISSSTQAGGLDSRTRGKEVISPGTAIDLTLEAGIPALGQALTSPLAGLGVTSTVGAGTSILGNILAQTRRVAMGEQEGFQGGQVVQAGLGGAIPFVGPARTANRVMQTAKNIGLNAAMQGGGGLAGSFARNAIDEGTLPSGSDAIISAGLPAIVGGVGSSIAEYGARKTLRSRRILENADIFGTADVTPTPGMLLPEELASIEQKLARDRRGGVEASRIDRTRQEMINKLNDAGGGAAVEGATIFSDLKPLLGQVTTAEEEIAKLTPKAIAARKVAGEKFRALREAEKAQQGDVKTEVRKAAETAMNEEYNANLEAILDNARELVTERVAGRRVAGLNPAQFRDLTVEHVAMPLRAAFKERADQMYSLVNNTVKGFDAKPILQAANEITKTASGTLPTDLKRAVDDLRALLSSANKEGMPVSLQDLRRARDQLMGRLDTGVPISSDEQRLVAGVTKKITSEIQRQAPEVLGTKGAQDLMAANEYYAQVRPLFDKPGVKVLFSNDPADEYVGKVLRGIQSSGTNSDEYRNVMSLVEEIRKTHPEQAGAVEDLFKSNLKESILFKARGKNLNPATSEYEVDPVELIKTLEPMGNTPGTLEALGFGNREQLAEMKRLFSDYKDASKLSDVQWEALFASDAFQQSEMAFLRSREAASALKDSSGKPVIVYHGRRGDMRTDATGKITSPSAIHETVSVSTNPEVANQYALEKRSRTVAEKESPRTYKLMLKEGKYWDYTNPEDLETLRSFGVQSDALENIKKGDWEAIERIMERARPRLEREGYKGFWTDEKGRAAHVFNPSDLIYFNVPEATSLKPLLEPFLAASAADTQLVRSVAEWKAGKVEASRRTYQEARDTLKQANGDLAALQSRRDSMLRDPVAVVLDNPNLPRESYDSFARAFFDPSPSKVTNDDLSQIVSTMEKGPRPVQQTLNRLRERYIADRIAVFKPAPESSKMAQELDTGKIRRFFEPPSPGDPSSELARAQTILTREQLGRLDDLAGVIRSVDLYERFGPGLVKPGSAELPFVGQPRRIVDAVVDLYRARKYDQMAEVVLDPAKFSRQQRISGERLIQGGGVIQQAGQGAARVLSR